jgi:hypothetical protein
MGACEAEGLSERRAWDVAMIFAGVVLAIAAAQIKEEITSSATASGDTSTAPPPDPSTLAI